MPFSRSSWWRHRTAIDMLFKSFFTSIKQHHQLGSSETQSVNGRISLSSNLRHRTRTDNKVRRRLFVLVASLITNTHLSQQQFWVGQHKTTREGWIEYQGQCFSYEPRQVNSLDAAFSHVCEIYWRENQKPICGYKILVKKERTL